MIVSMVCIVTSIHARVDHFSNASHIYELCALARTVSSTSQAAAASTDHCGLSKSSPPLPTAALVITPEYSRFIFTWVSRPQVASEKSSLCKIISTGSEK